MSIAWICSRKNWDLFFKKNGAEGCFGVAAQGKGCFLCPTNGRLSFLSRLCKKEGSLNNTRLLPHAKMLLVPMNFFPCQVDYALEETFRLGKCEFWPLIKFFFYTERSWHAYWFSLAGMICPLTALISLRSMVVLLSVLVVKTKNGGHFTRFKRKN